MRDSVTFSERRGAGVSAAERSASAAPASDSTCDDIAPLTKSMKAASAGVCSDKDPSRFAARLFGAIFHGLLHEREMLAQLFLQIAQIRPRLESG